MLLSKGNKIRAILQFQEGLCEQPGRRGVTESMGGAFRGDAS
jgi:hypothetical protein